MKSILANEKLNKCHFYHFRDSEFFIWANFSLQKMLKFMFRASIVPEIDFTEYLSDSKFLKFPHRALESKKAINFKLLETFNFHNFSKIKAYNL